MKKKNDLKIGFFVENKGKNTIEWGLEGLTNDTRVDLSGIGLV